VKVGRFSRALWLPIATLLLAAAPLGAAAEARDAGSEASRPKHQQNISERWGIEIESLRISAASYILDFRYRVIDAEKARPLFKRSTKPVLIDQASGARLSVPRTAKLGPLRNSDEPIAGRIYFMAFANTGKLIKPGDKVTIEIGEFRAEDLVVK
jgi:hypothetical protein